MAAQAAAVPKFGSWDAENIGYTVFFEKVRDNKGPPAPAAAAPKAPGSYDFDPYEHYENLSRKAAAKVRDNKGPPAPGSYVFDPYEHYENLSRKAPSRPPSSHGHGGGHAAAPKGYYGGHDYDPYEHYENLSSRNVPSRPPSVHGYGHAPTAAPRGYGGHEFDPYEHYENMSSRSVPSRPPSVHGHAPAPPDHQQHRGGGGGHGYHRRTGSNGSSVASETSSRVSRFSPPKPYQPRYSNNSNHQQQQAQQGSVATYGHGHGQYHPQGAPTGYKPYSSPSPPRGPPPPLRRPKASAVPRFGVWDEQNAAMAAQGFTVQFEKVKRHREEAKAAAAPPVPPQRVSPDRYAPAPAQRYGNNGKANRSFLSKMYRCMFPVVRD